MSKLDGKFSCKTCSLLQLDSRRLIILNLKLQIRVDESIKREESIEGK